MTAELAKWDSFYVIVGSAAGALIGLQFVVITLVAERPQAGTAEAGSAFSSPTVAHFGAVLFLSLLLHAPWETITAATALWGTLGLGGVVFAVIIALRMRRQSVYRPVFEDWLFYVTLPLVGYAGLAITALTASAHTRAALFGAGGATMLLLFTGIHNWWDSVSYHVLVSRPKQLAKAREESKLQGK